MKVVSVYFRISNIILDTNTLVYRMGLCLPASCTASDIQSFVSNLIESQLKIPGITVHLADDRCYTSEGLPWTVGDWIVM